MFSKHYYQLFNRPLKTFLLIAYIVTCVAMSFDTINYLKNEQSFLLTINVIGTIVLTGGLIWLLTLKNDRVLKKSAALLIYVLISNIYLSNLHLMFLNNTSWQYNFLRDTFVLALFITLGGFIIGYYYILTISILYVIFILLAWHLFRAQYIAQNALFLIFIMSGYSLAIYLFVRKFNLILTQNNELKQKIDFKNKELRLKEKELSERKISELENIVAYKKRELINNSMVYAKSVEINQKSIKKLQAILENCSDKVKKDVTDAISTLKEIKDLTHWEKFQKQFESIHQDFYININNQFPDLTPAEIRLAALLKLDLSSKEIALLTQTNKDSVDVARSRLRKKINIGRTENLTTFLSRL